MVHHSSTRRCCLVFILMIISSSSSWWCPSSWWTNIIHYYLPMIMILQTNTNQNHHYHKNHHNTNNRMVVEAWSNPLRGRMTRRRRKERSTAETTGSTSTVTTKTPSSSSSSSSSSSIMVLPRAPKTLPGLLPPSRTMGIMKSFQADAAKTLMVYADYCRQYNLPGVALPVGILGTFYYIVDPNLVQQVLVDKNNKNKNNYKEGIFYKSALDRRGVGLLTGVGSLLTDGPDHTRKRRLILPSMNNRNNLLSFLQIMEDVSLEYADSVMMMMTGQDNNITTTWTTDTNNATSTSTTTVNVGEFMAAVAMKIVGLALFSQDVVDNAIYQDIAVCLEHVVYVTRSNPLVTPPGWIPTRRNLRFRKSLQKLDALVYSFIDDASQNDSNRDEGETKNLLQMLLAARYVDDDDDANNDTTASSGSSGPSTTNSTQTTTNNNSGSGLTEQELRDEVMTLFLAGHETTAITLCWTLWYLSDPKHQHWQDAIANEYQRLNGTSFTPSIVEDPMAFQTTRAVLCEALRLRPPPYAVDRQVQQDVTLHHHSPPSKDDDEQQVQEIALKTKDLIAISFLSMHMDPNVFDQPHEFDPYRFLLQFPNGTKNFDYEPGMDLWEGPYNRSVYLPFGAGRKRCIGYKFAQWESVVILSTILNRYRVTRPPGVDTVTWEPGITLRPDRNLELCFEPR